MLLVVASERSKDILNFLPDLIINIAKEESPVR